MNSNKNWKLISRDEVYDGSPYIKIYKDTVMLPNDKIINDGFLAIHDVFPNPDDGGRPPYEIFLKAINSGKFKEYETVKSLKILKKVL